MQGRKGEPGNLLFAHAPKVHEKHENYNTFLHKFTLIDVIKQLKIIKGAWPVWLSVFLHLTVLDSLRCLELLLLCLTGHKGIYDFLFEVMG